MRYLKLASEKNPSSDFIELNDLNGFLCTSFQSLGISRKMEFLSINNRQFVVDNKHNFKKYNLTIEILSKYSEYEQKHRELITFLDRNKKDGFRLYFKPYPNMPIRYCLCNIESSVKTDKLQPINLVLVQNSLWLTEEIKAEGVQNKIEENNIFAFTKQEGLTDVDGNDYYASSFAYDESINKYCIKFYNGAMADAIIKNDSYNEIPLKIQINGPCGNPVVSLFRKGENSPIKTTEIKVEVSDNYYLEIDANINKNGVWYVNNKTGEKDDYSKYIEYQNGSPYFFIDNGEYVVKVTDSNQNICEFYVFYQEEYGE